MSDEVYVWRYDKENYLLTTTPDDEMAETGFAYDVLLISMVNGEIVYDDYSPRTTEEMAVRHPKEPATMTMTKLDSRETRSSQLITLYRRIQDHFKRDGHLDVKNFDKDEIRTLLSAPQKIIARQPRSNPQLEKKQ